MSSKCTIDTSVLPTAHISASRDLRKFIKPVSVGIADERFVRVNRVKFLFVIQTKSLFLVQSSSFHSDAVS